MAKDADVANDPETHNKENRKFFFCVAYPRWFSTSVLWVIDGLKIIFQTLLAMSTHALL